MSIVRRLLGSSPSVQVSTLLSGSYVTPSAKQPLVKASGGSVYRVGSYTVHLFTSSDTFTLLVPSLAVEVMAIAGGGGGGGSGSGYHGGGGGGGGMLAGSTTLSANAVIVVGAGGAGSLQGSNGSNGSNTTISGLTCFGGGGGGSNTAGAAGGCGGGQANSGTSGGTTQTTQSPYTGYGFAAASDGGGNSNGGGGTAGTGTNYSGGAGRAYDWLGTSLTYGAGGNAADTLALAGEPRGNGGNGGWNSFALKGGTGGRGLVLVRYLT